MTDVLTIAMQRRDRLRAEIGGVDQFLRLAIELAEAALAKAKVDQPVKDQPTKNIEPEYRREAAADLSMKPEATVTPAPHGRASLFRGAFAADDEFPRVING